MSPNYHFPPVSESSPADDFVAYLEQETEAIWLWTPGARTHIVTHPGSHSWIFPHHDGGLELLPLTHGQPLHPYSWCPHRLEDIAPILSSLYSGPLHSPWAAVCNLLLSTTSFCGTLLSWFSFYLSYHFLIPCSLHLPLSLWTIPDPVLGSCCSHFIVRICPVIPTWRMVLAVSMFHDDSAIPGSLPALSRPRFAFKFHEHLYLRIHVVIYWNPILAGLSSLWYCLIHRDKDFSDLSFSSANCRGRHTVNSCYKFDSLSILNRIIDNAKLIKSCTYSVTWKLFCKVK